MQIEVKRYPFEGNDVRVLLDDKGEPWFVAADVCKALGLANPRDAVSRLNPDEKTTVGNPDGRAGQGAQVLNLVSEPGAYRLVFTSRVEGAERFKRWLAHDVLPSIRKTGGYSAASPAPALPADYIQALEALLTAEKEKLRLAHENEAQAKLLEAQKPAVELAEQYLSAEGDRCLTDAATALCIPPKTFQKALEDDGFCYRRPGLDGSRKSRLLPHAEYVTRGYLVNRARLVTVRTDKGSKQKDFGQTMVTPAGMAYFHHRFAHLSTQKPVQQDVSSPPGPATKVKT